MTSGGGLGSTAIERLLLADVLLREIVEACLGKVDPERIHDEGALPEHPGREELDHQRVAEPIHHQAAQSIGLGMNEAVSVSRGIEFECVAPK
jgi:hypothetical protein